MAKQNGSVQLYHYIIIGLLALIVLLQIYQIKLAKRATYDVAPMMQGW